jgi:hypothetical protein
MKVIWKFILIWAALPVFAGIGAYFIQVYPQSQEIPLQDKQNPILVCPETVSLGEQETECPVSAQFTIGNSGGSELVITGIRAACSCSGLDKIVDGRPERIAELRLNPGNSQKVAVRYFVTEPGGGSQENTVRFLTNDPLKPEFLVRLRIPKILGGVTALPKIIESGHVLAGEKIIKNIEVINQSILAYNVDRVDHPDGTPWLKCNWTKSRGNENNPSLLGTLQVIVEPHAVARLNSSIRIIFSEAKRAPLIVPITGEAIPLVDISPKEIVFPRRTESGNVYFADVYCFFQTDDPFDLTFDGIPKGVTINSLPILENKSRKYRIEFDSNEFTLQKKQRICENELQSHCTW